MDNIILEGATSITCWSDECGMKTDMDNWKKDFPSFIENVKKGFYKPEEFVQNKYTYEKSTLALLQFANFVNKPSSQIL
jgi:hypothetical protein